MMQRAPSHQVRAIVSAKRRRPNKPVVTVLTATVLAVARRDVVRKRARE